MILWVFQAGTGPETARKLTAPWFLDHVGRSKFRHPAVSTDPGQLCHAASVNLRQQELAPYPVVVRLSGSGGPTMHVVFSYEDKNKNNKEDF